MRCQAKITYRLPAARRFLRRRSCSCRLGGRGLAVFYARDTSENNRRAREILLLGSIVYACPYRTKWTIHFIFYYAEDFGKVHGNNKFIEYYICRNCEGTTLGYKLADNGIEPILGERKNTLMDEEIHQNHETIQHFVHQYRQYKCLSEHSKSYSIHFSSKSCITSCNTPNKDMVVFLSKYLRWGNFFEKKNACYY